MISDAPDGGELDSHRSKARRRHQRCRTWRASSWGAAGGFPFPLAGRCCSRLRSGRRWGWCPCSPSRLGSRWWAGTSDAAARLAGRGRRGGRSRRLL